MTRTLVGCLLLGFALPSMAAEPGAFRFSKDVDRGVAQKESILAVTLDSDVYSATRAAFPDLRVFDSQSREIPYVVEKATEPRMHTVRRACGNTVVALHEHADDLDVLIKLDADAPAAEGLSIFTPLTNFERRVHVYGSSDGAQWTPLVAGRLVFDYSRYMDISNREVSLPKNGYRHLKVSITGIADAKESPFLELARKYRGGSESERIEKTVLERRSFRMDRIELWHERKEKLSENERKVDYRVAECRTEEDPAAKTTMVYIRTRREPLTELTLETASRNFSRPAVVQVPVTRGVRTEWVDIGHGQVSLVDFGGYHKETLGLFFPERRETEYRIAIRNEDNPPLKLTGVTARGNVYRVVLLAAENEGYRLCYGADELEQPKYDALAVLGPLRQGQATSEGRLGKEAANPAAGQPAAGAARALVKNPLFLGAVIVVLVAVLGWALFRAARRINEIPSEP